MTSDELPHTGAAHNNNIQPARPASPTGSLYAMSDDEEGDYNTITHTETGKGVKLLYSKSKVRRNLDTPSTITCLELPPVITIEVANF